MVCGSGFKIWGVGFRASDIGFSVGLKFWNYRVRKSGMESPQAFASRFRRKNPFIIPHEFSPHVKLTCTCEYGLVERSQPRVEQSVGVTGAVSSP